MEASGLARWFERLLAELQFELWIGDATEIRAKRVRKQKTDRQDAQLILKLMLKGTHHRVPSAAWPVLSRHSLQLARRRGKPRLLPQNYFRAKTETPCLRKRFRGRALGPCGPAVLTYLGDSCCCGGFCGAAAGAAVDDEEASCSRSFFRRLTSTRPPVMRFGLAPSSVAIGALPMPTT